MKLRSAVPLLLAAFPLLFLAQDVPPVSPPSGTPPRAAVSSGVPVDPVALLSLAREKNGLASSDVRPWHIRATYTAFDQNGKPKDHGTYEEWWVSPNKYKRMYAGSKFTQIDYATGTGLYREGSQGWPGGLEMILRSALINPLPEMEVISDFQPQEFEIAAGSAKAQCIRLGFALPPDRVVADDYFPTFFFTDGAPALRMFSQSPFQMNYNHIVIFQGRYMARELRVVANKKPLFSVEVETIEALKESPDDLLVPSNAAVAVNFAEPINLYEGGDHLLVLKGFIRSTLSSPKIKECREQLFSM